MSQRYRTRSYAQKPFPEGQGLILIIPYDLMTSHEISQTACYKSPSLCLLLSFSAWILDIPLDSLLITASEGAGLPLAVHFFKTTFPSLCNKWVFASFQWWLGRQRWSHWRLWTWSKWRHHYKTAVSRGLVIWWLLSEAASGHQQPQPLVSWVLATQISVPHSRTPTRESQLPEELHW